MAAVAAVTDISTEPTLSSVPLLITSWVCPYVQRVWVALAAKHATFSRAEVDLSNKPEWLVKFSPYTKVPAVAFKAEDGSTVSLHESLVLLEWVDERWAKDAPALLPAGPTERARARIIISRVDNALIPAWYKLMRSSSREEAHAVAATMDKELAWLQGQASPAGPFLQGAELSAVDCAVLPWLLRANVVHHYRGYDPLASFPKLQAYAKAARAHPAVQATLAPPEGRDWDAAMVEAYKGYGGSPVDYFKQ